MKTAFVQNISALRWVNLLFFILALLFSIFPVITEKAFIKASFYLGSAFIALVIFFITSHLNRRLKKRKQLVTSVSYTRFIYILIFLYYANVMFFGLYLAVWAEPEKIAGSFIGIFICVLFLLNISSVLYLCLTLIVLAFYITAIFLVKSPAVWNYDIQNAFFAGFMGLIFGWHIVMSRLTMISNAEKLKEESTVDELTQLRNRRDFLSTFNRFITHHRQSDNYLCIALIDIDCFKNYNDHYGHLQGDECLRVVGRTLNDLHRNYGIYAARVGGEEFALLWHISELSEAKETGDRVNKIIRDLNIPHEKSIVVPYITVSIGIYIAKCGVPHVINDLYNLADKALYTAKHNGRNCTVVSS